MGRSAKANEESFKDLNLPQLPVALNRTTELEETNDSEADPTDFVPNPYFDSEHPDLSAPLTIQSIDVSPSRPNRNSLPLIR